MNEPIPFQNTDRGTGAAQFFSRVQRYKTLLKRRWWVLLLTLAIAVGAQTFRASKSPLTFVSKAQLIVGNRAPVADAAAGAEDENFVGTTIALLTGNLIATRARQAVEKEEPLLPQSAVKLEVSLVPRTSIFLLQARGEYPKYTHAYLNAVMDEFLKYRQEIRGKSTEETMRAVTAEATKAQEQIIAGKKELEAFRNKYNVAFVEEEATSSARRQAALQNDLAALDREYRLLESLKSVPIVARAGEKGDPTAGLDLREQDRTRQQLEILQKQKVELEEVLKPKHPKMIKIEEEIAKQQKLLEIYQKQTAEQLEQRRDSLKKQIETLQLVLQEESTKAQEASRRVAEYEGIRAKIQSAESLATRIATMLDQVKIGKEVPVETVSVLEPATVAKADNSGFTKNILIGCFIGVVFGIGILFLLDRFDDRPISFTELQEHFDEMVLGQIPQESTRGGGRLLPLAVNDNRYAYAEAHRNLRSSLIFMAIEGARPRTIVITSAVPGEGKSSVAVNLAITMAFSGSRVLLIDADMRKGTVHEYFELPSDRPGLSDVLAGEAHWEEVVHETHVPKLSVMPHGSFPPNPGELLLTGADGLLREIYEQYDFVLFDSAPVLAADDTASLAPKVDGTLFVIRAAYTSTRLARNALELLYQRQVNVMGIVFNSVETKSREYNYFKYPEYYSKGMAQR
jgi:succinoglycan biosynthesis transport protein ExoP